MRVYLDPKYLDTKQREILDSLILRDIRVDVIDDRKSADYVIIDSRQINNETRLREKKHIVCDFGDVPGFMGGLHTHPKKNENEFRGRIKKNGQKLIYLKVEWDMPYTSSLYKPDEDIFYLSCPILLGGSSKNIYIKDGDGDLLFSKSVSKNPKEYKFLFGHIGHRSSYDRKWAEFKLWEHGEKFYNLNTNLKRGNLKPAPNIKPLKGQDCYVISTRHIRPRHQDSRANLDFKHSELMEIFRQTKINISCNGHGVWCLKDGELFSRNCFVMRQNHPHLTRNPLTPKDGKHWVVFKKGSLIRQLEYYLKNEDERERINDAGFRYFKDGIMGKWASYYADRFIGYLANNNRGVFGDLLL